MRRLYYQRNGSPPEVVELEHVAEPPPAPGEVVVALEASPLHIADLKAIEGTLGFIPPGAGVPGFEGVGIVTEVGSRVYLDAPELEQRIAPLAQRLALDAIGGEATARLGGCIPAGSKKRPPFPRHPRGQRGRPHPTSLIARSGASISVLPVTDTRRTRRVRPRVTHDARPPPSGGRTMV